MFVSAAQRMRRLTNVVAAAGYDHVRVPDGRADVLVKGGLDKPIVLLWPLDVR